MRRRTIAKLLWLTILGALCTAGALAVTAKKPVVTHTPAVTLERPMNTSVRPQPKALNHSDGAVKVTSPNADYSRKYSSSNKIPNSNVSAEAQAWQRANAKTRANSLDSQGGPDAFGYRYVDNRGDSVAFNWIELCGDAAAADGPIGDNGIQLVNWGWSFPFYGSDFTSTYVSTNGLLSFGAADGSFLNDCIANITPNVPKIYAYWDDQTASGAGGCNNDGQGPWVRYRDFGSYLVVEWINLPHYETSNDRFTYEAILFPSGLIKLQYSADFASPDNANAATVGIDAPAADQGLEYVCDGNGNNIGPSTAVCFFPQPACSDFTVTAPGSWVGNTCRAWNNCDLKPFEDLTYQITIPRDGNWTFSLCDANPTFPVYLALSTECCGGEVLADDYGDCPMPYIPIMSEISCIPLTAGVYYVDVEAEYGGCGQFVLNVWECVPCEPVCPENAVIETEDCFDGYVDNYDGGCNSNPPAFIPIANDAVVCGTSGQFWTDGQRYRDTDWYQITTTDTSIITWSVQADFNVLALIIDGNNGCPEGGPVNLTGAPARMCSTATAVTRCILPGTYWLFVAPQGMGGVPCGSHYMATVHVEECTPPTPPPNDDCQNCFPMPDIPGTYTGVTTNATRQCNVLDDPEVWQCFTINECNDVTITFCGTDPVFQTGYVVIFNSCPCGDPIYCGMYEWFSCGDGNVTMHWYALPAGTYYLPVIDEVDWHASGTYNINISAIPCPPPPANDFCETATGPLAIPSSTAGTTLGAEWDPDLPNCGTDVSAPGVWYTVLGTGNVMTASTCNQNISFDTKITVFCGECGAFYCVGANDDNCPEFGMGASSLSWCSEIGRTYFILVHGYDGAVGSFQLDVSDDGHFCTNAPACEPCFVTAGPNDIPENEPECYDEYVDEYNGGCNSSPSHFDPQLESGDTLYGTSGTFALGGMNGRDTDWFLYTCTRPETLEFGAIAEFPVQIIIMGPGPNGDCADSLFYSYGAFAGRCAVATTETPWAIDPGTYWLFLSPQDFTGVPCGAHYRAWVHSRPVVCDPVLNLTSYITADQQHVWLHFTAPTAGAYDIYSSTNKNNDGNPDEGADPNFTLETTVTATAPGAISWTDPSLADPYKNYVVIHNCNLRSAPRTVPKAR